MHYKTSYISKGLIMNYIFRINFKTDQYGLIVKLIFGLVHEQIYKNNRKHTDHNRYIR